MTMNVSLTPELEQFVEEKIKSGMYKSQSEVIRESLRLLKREDELRDNQLEDLRREIRIGLNELKEGKGESVDSVQAHLKSLRGKKAVAAKA